MHNLSVLCPTDTAKSTVSSCALESNVSNAKSPCMIVLLLLYLLRSTPDSYVRTRGETGRPQPPNQGCLQKGFPCNREENCRPCQAEEGPGRQSSTEINAESIPPSLMRHHCQMPYCYSDRPDCCLVSREVCGIAPTDKPQNSAQDDNSSAWQCAVRARKRFLQNLGDEIKS